jgi:hypothetical protein
MKINIYAADLTHDLDTEQRQAANGRDYVGLRFHLRTHYRQDSLKSLRQTTATLTLWSAANAAGTGELTAEELADLLETAAKLLRPKPTKPRTTKPKRP